MSPTIPDNVVREVLARTSIVQLVGEFVALKKAGSRHKGLCPFHHEKTPSFTVNEELGFFHCFGCGESGDGISFLRKHNGLSFVEAVEQLAGRAGIQVVADEDPAAARASRARKQRERSFKEELHRVLATADDWFQRRLAQAPPDSIVRGYVQERGLTDETVRTFHLGHAPNEWGALADFFASQRLPVELAEKVGLIVPRKSSRGYYDRFRNRLVFPIFDLTEQVIGFGGRRLPGDEDSEAAKYINSPDSPLYTKGDVLFGLAQAKRFIRTEGKAVVVEGNIDLLMLHQEGMRNVVAPMGTALTVQQVHLLRRFTESVVLLYDGDAAGKKAARAALMLLLEAGSHGFVATLPDGEDPDSFVRNNGIGALRELIDRAAPLVEHLIDETVAQHGLSAHGQAKALEDLAPVLARVTNPRERDLLTAKVASALRLEERRVAAMLANPQLRRAEAAQIVPLAMAPHKMALRERKLVEVALWHPSCLAAIEEAEGPDLIGNDALRGVLWEAITLFGEDGRLHPQRLVELLADHPLATWVADVICREPDVSAEGAEAFVVDAMRLLKLDRLKDAIRTVAGELERAQKSGDEQRVLELLGEKATLGRQLKLAEAGGTAQHPVTRGNADRT